MPEALWAPTVVCMAVAAGGSASAPVWAQRGAASPDNAVAGAAAAGAAAAGDVAAGAAAGAAGIGSAGNRQVEAAEAVARPGPLMAGGLELRTGIGRRHYH